MTWVFRVLKEMGKEESSEGVHKRGCVRWHWNVWGVGVLEGRRKGGCHEELYSEGTSGE